MQRNRGKQQNGKDYRDLFKKIRDTKGTFHAKMGTIKDLTEAEDIKKRWQEYTEELYKKDPNDPDNHDGVITHLEPEILDCEVKWALGSITTNRASGGDGIPAELFQILKHDAVISAALNIPANMENSAVARGQEKISFPSNPKEGQCRRMFKLPHKCIISHASKVMFKILQARLQQYMNQQAGFRKGRGTRDQIANIHWIIEKAREFQKNIYFCFIDYTKAFDCVDHNKL